MNLESNNTELIPLYEAVDENRELSVEETRTAVRHLTMLICADDERVVRSAIMRPFSRAKKADESSIDEIKDGSIDERLARVMQIIEEDANKPLNERKLPILTCESGSELNRALELLKEVNIEGDAMIISDNIMGSGLTGIECIMEHEDELPANFTRILVSAYTGDDMGVQKALETGTIDEFLEKPVQGGLNPYLRAFLKHKMKQEGR